MSYCSTTSHSPKQTAINLNHLLHRLTRDPVPGGRARVGGHYDAALEAEGEGGGAVGDLDGAGRVAVVVGHGAQPGGVATDGRELEVVG